VIRPLRALVGCVLLACAGPGAPTAVEVPAPIEVRFGVVELDDRGEAYVRETRTLPLMTGETGFSFGFEIVAPPQRRYTLRFVHHLPKGGRIQGNYTELAPELGRNQFESETLQKTGRHVERFGFDETDQPGPHQSEVWIDGRQLASIRFRVVERTTRDTLFHRVASDRDLGLLLPVPDGWIAAPAEIAGVVTRASPSGLRFSFVVARLGESSTQLSVGTVEGGKLKPGVTLEALCEAAPLLLGELDRDVPFEPDGTDRVVDRDFCVFETQSRFGHAERVLVGIVRERVTVISLLSTEADQLDELRARLDALEIRG
jgi:hypothetical protein